MEQNLEQVDRRYGSPRDSRTDFSEVLGTEAVGVDREEEAGEEVQMECRNLMENLVPWKLRGMRVSKERPFLYKMSSGRRFGC